MAIGIFRRPYTIRRHGKQQIVNGHAVSGDADITVKLNVQPLSADELLALPEGERTIARVKTFGADALKSADEHSGTPGDLLYFSGRWYECKSCVHWLHTPLKHYEAEFVVLADQTGQRPPVSGGDTVDP
ncbi:hypothetical protein FACS1894208_12750 [Clostridia bacterium]|nr:hypothetical protein FACS1894208_12750 [Clostridia bacterium]